MARGVHLPERREPGGSLELCGIAAEHPAAFAYDWRTRFGVAFDDVGGRQMLIGEALLHVKTLAKDPTSWVHASLAEWEHPASREFFVLADLFDAFAKVNFKKPTPYPRPLPDETKERFGAPIAPAEMGDVLRAFGHDPATLIDWPGYESPEKPKPEPRMALNPHD